MKNIRELFFGFILLFSSSAFAEEGSFNQAISNLSQNVDGFFNEYTGWFVGLIFKSVPVGEASFPIIVGWLLLAAIIFTVYFGFVQFKRVGMAIDIIKGKYTDPNSKHEGEFEQGRVTAHGCYIYSSRTLGNELDVTKRFGLDLSTSSAQ